MQVQNGDTDKLAELIFEKISEYASSGQIAKLTDAYNFAKTAHSGQLRKSGEPYLVHPLRTIDILTNLRVDKDTLIAGLLHDVPEDTGTPISEIEKRFGEKVAYLVDGITKLSKVHYRERMEQRQIESLKKLFIHSAQDLRVILIKLADRLDNMRTLRFIAKEEKRHRIAKETLEIYAPIANILGLGQIRAELEDLCFEHLYPAEYSNLKKEIEENVEERNFILDEMIRITQKELKKNKIDAEIIGRPKSLYSIYKKLQEKQSIYNIDDIIAIRAIVPTRKDCYDVLGIIHRLFKPKISRFKDYIAVPKPNGYQSLHTTVFGLNGSIVEFQIRTEHMHLEAEYGIAAHYFYKYANNELTPIIKKRSTWVQRILDIQRDQKNSQNFIEDLKLDIFEDRIFVFSPKGEVIDLPRGAGAIDFAYAIHTDVGNHAAKAEINGVVCPITATLGNGDVVNIVADKEVHPELEWINSVRTSLALHKIKDFLKQEPKEKKLSVGKKTLEKEFDHIGKIYLDELSPKRIEIIAKKYKYKTLDQIFTAIAEGNLDAQNILETIYDVDKLEFQTTKHLYRIGIKIIGDNDKNQFREIMRTLNSLNIPIEKFAISRPWYLNRYKCKILVLVKDYSQLAQVFECLEHIEGVQEISRFFLRRKIGFIITSFFTTALWVFQPFLIDYVIGKYGIVASNTIIYAGMLLLLGLVFYFKRMTLKSFPELVKTTYYWPFLYGLTTLAFLAVFGEIYSFKLEFRWVFVLILIVAIYSLLTASYVSYKKEQTQE